MPLNSTPTYWSLRDYLWSTLPEVREVITRFEQGHTDSGWGLDAVSPYGYMSEVFMWGVFAPAAERGDKDVTSRCFEIVEEMLGSGDQLLVECTDIRVVEKIHYSDRLVEDARSMAGPLLREMLREDTGDESWAAW